MEVQGFIPLLRRWWWLLVLGTVVAGVVSYAITTRIDPTYEAEVGLLTGPISTDEGTVRASGALAASLARRRPRPRYDPRSATGNRPCLRAGLHS